MFDQATATKTPAEIADAANANGWRTKEHTARRTGKRHGGNLSTVRQVIATLRNPVYLGLFRDKDDFRIGHHEPMVTHELFASVTAQLIPNAGQTLPDRLAAERAHHMRGLQQAYVAAHHPVSELSLSILQVPLDSRRAEALRLSGFRTRYRRCAAAESGTALGPAFGC